MTGTRGDAALQTDDFSFTAANLAKAKAIIARYPKGRQASAVMPLLDLGQRQNGGWLLPGAVECVAEMLDMPFIRVWEVASFYTMYNCAPVGRNHVQVCTNISCWLRGSDDVLDTCRNALDVEVGETTDDGLFTLSEVECLGACVNAPTIMINDNFYEDLDAGSTQAILNTLKDGGTPTPGPQNGRRGCESAAGPTTLSEVPLFKPKKPAKKRRPAKGKPSGGT